MSRRKCGVRRGGRGDRGRAPTVRIPGPGGCTGDLRVHLQVFYEGGCDPIRAATTSISPVLFPSTGQVCAM